MTESELLLLASEYQNRTWILNTWSVSIGIALFTMAYLVGRKLTVFQLIFVIVTYVLYTVVVVRNVIRIGANQAAIQQELAALQESGVQLTAVASQIMVNYADVFSIPTALLETSYQILLFLGAITYLVVQFSKGQKDRVNGT